MLTINDAQEHCEPGLMREMFEERKRVFVDLLRWDVPVLAGRYEVDQFDTPLARYLIVTDTAGRHAASARLLPTTRPHLLSVLFEDLCDERPPTGPSVVEISRFCLGRGLTTSERHHARNQLVTALAVYAQQQGVASYTGVAEKAWFEQIRNFGWTCRALGPCDGLRPTALVALQIEVGLDTLEQLRRHGVYAPASFRAISSDDELTSWESQQ